MSCKALIESFETDFLLGSKRVVLTSGIDLLRLIRG
jgi:hypothetical protein